MSPSGIKYIVADGKDLAAMVVEEISRVAKENIVKKGSFNLGLSGGSLISLFASCSNLCKDNDNDYSQWKVFLIDERCVPIKDDESTFGNYKRYLGEFVGLVNFQIPFTGGGEQVVVAQEAAKAYEDLLKSIGPLDMVVLGIGPDGHLASIFPPVTMEMLETKSLVQVIENSPKPPPIRITMTLPYLKLASQITFVVTGRAKSDIIKSIFTRQQDTTSPLLLPCTILNSSLHGNCNWFLDSEAAVGLQ